MAQNSYTKTHPLMARAAAKAGEPHRVFLHAEVAALLKCDWSKAYSLHVYRFNNEGKPLNAKPCKCCQEVIRMAGIKLVEHT